MPNLSIITVVYNNLEGLKTCIESAEGQSYKEIEHVIIDGKSTDGSAEFAASKAAEMPGRYKLVSEPDQGIYDAMNKGIQKASGEYIGFLHSDDLFSSDNVMELVMTELEAGGFDGIYGNLKYVDETNTEITLRDWRAGAFKPANLKYGWMPPHPTLYLRKALYQEVGKFDLELKVSADYHFMLRLLVIPSLRISYLDQYLVSMRVGGNSNRWSNIPRKLKEDLFSARALGLGWWFGFVTVFCKNARKTHQLLNINSIKRLFKLSIPRKTY